MHHFDNKGTLFVFCFKISKKNKKKLFAEIFWILGISENLAIIGNNSYFINNNTVCGHLWRQM